MITNKYLPGCNLLHHDVFRNLKHGLKAQEKQTKSRAIQQPDMVAKRLFTL